MKSRRKTNKADLEIVKKFRGQVSRSRVTEPVAAPPPYRVLDIASAPSTPRTQK
jgi:hypothetical protein